MAYATPDDLGELLAPDPAPANAARLLTRASRDIDSALKCAVYDIDASGNPTDPDIIDAFRDATCEQAAWRLENGDDEGLTTGYTSVKIGSVALSKGSRDGKAAGSVERLCEQARQILDAAGLLGFEPWTG